MKKYFWLGTEKVYYDNFSAGVLKLSMELDTNASAAKLAARIFENRESIEDQMSPSHGNIYHIEVVTCKSAGEYFSSVNPRHNLG